MLPFRKIFTNFKPYQSARGTVNVIGRPQRYAPTLLDANENPFPNNGKNRYPDPIHSELCDYIANTKSSQFSVDIKAENIMLGNGSDECIDLLIRLFCEPKEDSICITSPTFGMYSVSANINNIEIVDIPLDENFELSSVIPEIFRNEVEKNYVESHNTQEIPHKLFRSAPQFSGMTSSISLPKLLFLCHPNNPTGNTIPEKKLIEIFESTKNTNTMIVVDEAYIDYCTEKSVLKYQKKYPNIIVLHTFSKMWGLAGCRVGCVIAHPGIIEKLQSIKPVYNVSVLNADAVKNQIDIKEKLFQQRNEIVSQRFYLESELQTFEIIEKVYPSKINFLLVKFTKDATKIYAKLIQNNIIVRDFSSYPYLKNCLRITVGTQEENIKLLSVLNS